MIRQLLIADSESSVRERCRSFFTNQGYQVETAADGLECLFRLRRQPPDVLVLERELLWGGGDGVLGCLSEDRCRPPETIVLTTSQTDGELPRLQVPLNAVLRKPVSLSALVEAIRQAQYDTELAARFLKYAQEVAARESYHRQCRVATSTVFASARCFATSLRIRTPPARRPW